MPGFDALPGNTALKASLRTALDRRFPQAVLLSGPDGSGKTDFAQTIAAALLCTGASPRPCGACASCHKVAHGTHPDLIVIDEGDGEIKIETARNIRDEAAILPNDGDRKVFIIHNADRMNLSAQNALLKVLEEPPRYVFFILLSSQPGVLLQTIRSRCAIYQLEPPHVSADQNPELLEPSRAFLRAMAKGDEYGMLLGANGFAKLNKAAFQQAMTLLGTALRDAALGLGRCCPARPGTLRRDPRPRRRTDRGKNPRRSTITSRCCPAALRSTQAHPSSALSLRQVLTPSAIRRDHPNNIRGILKTEEHLDC